jgi:hypothetical protein
LVSLTFACGGTDDNGPAKNSGGQAALAGSSTGGGALGGGGGQGQGTGGTGGSTVVEGTLPNGAGREYNGIVNLVDAAATKALDDYILEADPFMGGSGELDLEAATRLFYQHYSDEYDFIYFVTEHKLDTSVAGLHGWVTKPPMPGTGAEEPICTGKGPAHLRSAVAIQMYNSEAFPPFAHEFAHYFACHLDDSFGFSRDVDTVFQGHWGMTSANGQLGGFDGNTLFCETPAGAKPPACTPGADGRIRYVVAPFFPNTELRIDQPFSPLELYMMGLQPLAEIPQTVFRFDGADFKFDAPETTADDKLIINGTGVTEIKMSDIVAKHGEVPALPADKRSFKAAVVLVTAAPAAQPVLDRVVEWAKVFGGEIKSTKPGWVSFSDLTGGRATMSLKVGPRHEPIPSDALDFSCPTYDLCDPRAQNCAGGLACYGISDFYCAPAGTGDLDTDCLRDSDCKKGSVCVGSPTDATKFTCAPYCDHVNADAANACAKLCPTLFSPIYSGDSLVEKGAICFAGAGGACDPLLQDCKAGQTCTGLDITGCEPAGTGKAGEVCPALGGGCEKGTVCVGIQGEPDQFCQPYCDNAPGATGANACATKCPGGAWDYDGYSVCIPN